MPALRASLAPIFAVGLAGALPVAIVAVVVSCAKGAVDADTVDASGSGPVDAWTLIAADSTSSTADTGASSLTDATPATGDAAAEDGATLDDAGSLDAGDGGCVAPQIVCDGTCVNPNTDPQHCGGCFAVCASGVCGTTIRADMTTQPANWSFNGTALWDSVALSARMTTAGAAAVAGTVVYNDGVITDAFDASFQFRMGENGGGRYDGMGFMIETTGATAVGGASSALGMATLGGYGVELDVYDNNQCGDSTADHVGIDLLQACSSSSTMPTSLSTLDLTGTIDIGDATWHTAAVTLASGAMSVTIDGKASLSNVALTNFKNETTFFYGFAGATGGGSSNGGIQTEVRDVVITFPSPRCL